MPNTFENVRVTTTLGLESASSMTLPYDLSWTYSWYASSTRIVVSGDARLTRSTNAMTSLLLCTVAVGLFGLQKYTSPTPFDASAIALRSRLSLESTGGALTGCLRNFAKLPGASNVGSGATS